MSDDYYKYKHDQDKTRWDLLPWEVLEDVANVMTAALGPPNNYGECSWRTVPDGRKRYLSAMMRHLRRMQEGERFDPDSRLQHAAHFACCALFLAALYAGDEET